MKRLFTFLRAWFNKNGSDPDFRIWQCMKLSRGKTGSACQKLSGHLGHHIGYGGDTWS